MQFINRLNGVLGSRDQVANAPQSHLLGPFEIRLISEGKLEGLADFAASDRLHATDSKGDTPLHIAARLGNLSVCDLFIRSGANPAALNHDRQTPADVAFVEGYRLAAQFLSLLVPGAQEAETPVEPGVSLLFKDVATEPSRILEQHVSLFPETKAADGLDDLLTFEAEAEPEDFFDRYAGDTVKGTFVALVSSPPGLSDQEGADWDLDLSHAPIAGDGIATGTGSAALTDHGAESDFLLAPSRGRRSVKQAVVQTGTRKSIDPGLCVNWAYEVLSKGCCSLDDIDRLVADCEGNSDPEELCTNIRRNLEAAGFNFDPVPGYEAILWDFASDVSPHDLADAIEAALTTRAQLPGSKRFVMTKAKEQQLLEPMIRARQELQLGVLASKTAVETILEGMDRVREGSRDPRSVTLRTLIPSRSDNAETSEVMAAVEALRSWHINGRVIDGKQRRAALAALDVLDLSMNFLKEVVHILEQSPTCQSDAGHLEKQILISEASTEHLIIEHLPYVRRFASRNVEEGEDPEDVFQVAFMGLQRSIRRFDPERGYRFLIYATYWMRQSITRWRADEGAAVRIPVNRNERIIKLDRAIERLEARVGGAVSDSELAEELEWTIDEVQQFRSIPRNAEYPESLDDWDDLLPEPLAVDFFEAAETKRILRDALAELPERQADVVRMRFGIERESDMTLEEVGQVYGVTRERIRQIEKKGLQLLSHPGRKRRLSELLGL